jgi:hypothetical protein
VSTRFCDRQTDGLTDRQKVQKQYVSPRMGGDIIRQRDSKKYLGALCVI